VSAPRHVAILNSFAPHFVFNRKGNLADKLLIDGEFVQGAGATDPVLDAATGLQIAEVASATGAQVDAQWQRLNGAFVGWRRHPRKIGPPFFSRLQTASKEMRKHSQNSNRRTPANRWRRC